MKGSTVPARAVTVIQIGGVLGPISTESPSAAPLWVSVLTVSSAGGVALG